MWPERRGAVMTAKPQGLWDLRGDITQEDVQHMQSRVNVFHCKAKVPKLRDTSGCHVCMCRWIRDGATARDAAPLAQPVLPLAPESNDQASGNDTVQGFEALSVDAQVPPAVASFFLRELRALGVVHVAEVTPGDWPQLQAWVMLRPYERRRLLSVAGAQREFA